MQVSEQEFGTRLVNYVQNISSQQKINISKKIVPDPVIGFGLCMWAEENFTAGDSFEPSKLHSKKLEGRTETRARNIFLNQIQPYGLPDKIREQTRKSLQNNVVGHFNKKSYRSLSTIEKEVYEWLEFISCGHLMTAKDVKKIKNKYIQEAYKMSELEFVSRDRLQGEIPQLWTEFKSAKELQKSAKELQATDAELKKAAKLLARSFIDVSAETLREFKELGEKSQKYLIQELEDRYTNVDVSKYKKEMLQPTTRPSTNEETVKKKAKTGRK